MSPAAQNVKKKTKKKTAKILQCVLSDNNP